MEENEKLISQIDSKIKELEYKIGKALFNKDGDLTKEEQIKFAKALLNCTNEDGVQVIDLSEKDPNINAVYVKSNDEKAIIVDSKKEILVENPKTTSFEKQLEDYINGERTELQIEDTKEERIQKADALIGTIDDKIKELQEQVKKELLNKDGDLTKEEQINLGKALLNCSNKNSELSIIDLSEKDPTLDATYIGIKDRGGTAIIVNSKKEYLTATSSVDFERHLQEFINGRRTNN